VLLSDEDFHLIVGAYFRTHRCRSCGAGRVFFAQSYKDLAPPEPFFNSLLSCTVSFADSDHSGFNP